MLCCVTAVAGAERRGVGGGGWVGVVGAGWLPAGVASAAAAVGEMAGGEGRGRGREVRGEEGWRGATGGRDGADGALTSVVEGLQHQRALRLVKLSHADQLGLERGPQVGKVEELLCREELEQLLEERHAGQSEGRVSAI